MDMMDRMKKPTEVVARAKRRQFSVSEKLRILAEAEACQESGAISALLRREGLYSSHLTSWRRQREAGQLGAGRKKRGPAAQVVDAHAAQLAALERKVAHAEARAARAERLCELQKKVSELFGLALPATEALPPGGRTSK